MQRKKKKESVLMVSGGFLTPMIGTPVPVGYDIKKVPDGKVMMVPMDNAETNDIYTVVIVGMGALGLLFGSQIREGMDALGLTYENQILQKVETDGAYLGRMIRQGMRGSTVFFLMDEERKQHRLEEKVRINGEDCAFQILTPQEIWAPADLVIVATKYNGLREAAKLMRPAVGEDTTIISLLNGISSEEILGEYYNRDQIIDCVAIGMDAMREGSCLSYQNAGRMQVGITKESQKKRLDQLVSFFERTNVSFEVCGDIRKAMWNKFMINVGINQTCLVYECSYGKATSPGPELEDMTQAMQEVVRVAAAEGISLTQEDFEKDMELLRSLNPEGYPSMRQDALAERKTEVDLFAGTVVSLAEKHGIPVPVNKKYLEQIGRMEAGFR